MPLLILVIASFLFFPLVVILFYIANTLESRTQDKKKQLQQASGLTLLSIADAFDPVFCSLWTEPIAALGRVDSAGPAGLSPRLLRSIYSHAAACFPEVYDDCTFLQWIRFLETSRLITWCGDRIVLTSEGHAFLRFRFVTSGESAKNAGSN